MVLDRRRWQRPRRSGATSFSPLYPQHWASIICYLLVGKYGIIREQKTQVPVTTHSLWPKFQTWACSQAPAVEGQVLVTMNSATSVQSSSSLREPKAVHLGDHPLSKRSYPEGFLWVMALVYLMVDGMGPWANRWSFPNFLNYWIFGENIAWQILMLVSWSVV